MLEKKSFNPETADVENIGEYVGSRLAREAGMRNKNDNVYYIKRRNVIPNNDEYHDLTGKNYKFACEIVDKMLTTYYN